MTEEADVSDTSRGPNTAFAIFYIVEGVIGTIALCLTAWLMVGLGDEPGIKATLMGAVASVPGFLLQAGYVSYLLRPFPWAWRVGLWAVSLAVNVFTAFACVVPFLYAVLDEGLQFEIVFLVLPIMLNGLAISGLGVWALVREVRAERLE